MKEYFEQSGRGLNRSQVEMVKRLNLQSGFLNGILSELQNPHTDIWLGIRNGYFNLYVEGASLGKVSLDKESINIHKKYLGSNVSGYKNLSLFDSEYKFKQIAENIKKFHLQSSQKYLEKKFQQKLVMSNNFAASPWYCVDMEYVMKRQNNSEMDCGRADIIAISRRPLIDNKFQILMIELKIGSGSFGESSGICEHFADFVKYNADKNYDCGDGYKGRFTRLRGEVVNILRNYKALGLLPENMNSTVADIKIDDIYNEPQMVFLIYSKDFTKVEIKRSFCRYVGGKAFCNLGTESEYSIVKKWDEVFVERIFNENIKCVFREGKDTNAIKDRQPLFEDENISEAEQIFKDKIY